MADQGFEMDCDQGNATLRVSGLMMRFSQANEELQEVTAASCFGLTPQQMQAAMWLAHHDGQTVGDLAQALGVTPGWASRLAEELVACGKAVRERDSRDRRIARLSLAPELKDVSQRVGDERFAATENVLRQFDATEVDVFCRIFDRLVLAFEQLARDQALANSRDPNRHPALPIGS